MSVGANVKKAKCTYCSKRPHLSDSLQLDLVWHAVKVKDKLRKLTSIMTLPLANILKVVTLGCLRTVDA